MTTNERDNRRLTVGEVATRLGVSEKTVRRELAAGRLHHERVGPADRLVRVPAWALDRYLGERFR